MIAKISQYHGRRFSRLNVPTPGKYGRSTAGDPEVAGRQRLSAAEAGCSGR